MREQCKSAKQQVSDLRANVSPFLPLRNKWPKFASTTWQTKRGVAIWLMKIRKQTLPEKSTNSKFHIPSHCAQDVNVKVKHGSTLKFQNLSVFSFLTVSYFTPSRALRNAEKPESQPVKPTLLSLLYQPIEITTMAVLCA